MPHLLSPYRPRTWILLAMVLMAGGVIVVVMLWTGRGVAIVLDAGRMRTQALLVMQTLQHHWEAIHLVTDNLRGALAPDSGGKAACRSGLLGAIERVVPGLRALVASGLQGRVD